MTHQPTTNDSVNWRSLYPFDSHLVTIGEVPYHYLDEGTGDALLMVHGNPTWSFLWRNLISEFRQDYRLIAPDHMGCGMSGKPQQNTYTLQTHVDHLVELIERLDLRQVTLLAHDWGGAIGLGAALAVPDRFARFILFNTGAFPPPFVPWRIRLCRLPWLGTWAIRRLNLFARCAMWMATTQRGGLPKSARAGFLAPYDCWQHRVALDKFVRDIPLSPRHPTYKTLKSIEDQLSTLADFPFQFIWGMKDWCFRPECLERFQRSLPHAEIHRLQEAGHFVTEDAHDLVVSLVTDFLTRHQLDVLGPQETLRLATPP